MTLLLDAYAIESLITVSMGIEAMELAARLEAGELARSAGRIDMSGRAGWLRLLPASIDGLGVMGFKAVNQADGVGARYQIHLYDIATGGLLAILDGRQITASRTAGCAAVAARHLLPAVSTIALIGTGFQARAQLQALWAVYPGAQFKVYSRSPANRSRFVVELSDLTGADIIACRSVEEATAGCELITLAVKSPTPVLEERHVKPGVHISSVGATRHDQRELAPTVFACCAEIIFDDTELVSREAGDALDAARLGLFSVDHARSLSDLARDGRRSPPGSTTLFKSVGTAVQDLVLAHRVYELARSAGLGLAVVEFPQLKGPATAEAVG